MLSRRKRTTLILASAPLPSDVTTSPPSIEMEDFIKYCLNQKFELVINCDSKAFHFSWSSKDNNARVILQAGGAMGTARPHSKSNLSSPIRSLAATLVRSLFIRGQEQDATNDEKEPRLVTTVTNHRRLPLPPFGGKNGRIITPNAVQTAMRDREAIKEFSQQPTTSDRLGNTKLTQWNTLPSSI